MPPKKNKKKGTAARSNNKKKNSSKKKKPQPSSVAAATTAASTRAIAVDDDGNNTTAAAPAVALQRRVLTVTEKDIRQSMGARWKLNDFPMSNHHVVALNLRRNMKDDEALRVDKLGIENDGCVWCLYAHADTQRNNKENFHAAVPYYLEAAIRGHTRSMSALNIIYIETSQTKYALLNFWRKIIAEFDPTFPLTQDERRTETDRIRGVCNLCGTGDLPEHHLCEGCRVCSYCCKSCQRKDWIENNHRGECRQVKILKHHYRSHAKEIRNAITSGVDPKTIKPLQRVRRKLGLNRPREDYEQLLALLDNDDAKDKTKSPNMYEYVTMYEYITGRPRDGTVHIGSTPDLI